MALPDSERTWPGRYLDALRYSAGAGVLMTLGILSLARVGASSLPLFGIPLHVAIWLGAYKYAYEVLHDSAQGRDAPPEVHDLVEPAVADRHVWVQGLLLVALVFASRWYGEATRDLFAVAFIVVLPLLLVALTVTHSVLYALSPRAWLLAGRTLGGDYFALLPVVAMAVVLQVYAPTLIPIHWPRWPTIFLYYLLAHFLLFVAYRLVGALVYERRADLGFEVESLPTLTPPALRRERELLDAVARRVLDGDRDGAITELATKLATAASPALDARYRELLHAQGDREALQAHARHAIARMLARGEQRQAVAVAAESVSADAHFVPALAEDALAIALVAERQGSASLAAAIASNGARAWPRTAAGLELARLALRLLQGTLGRASEAERLLGELLRAQKDPARIEALQALRRTPAAR